MTCVLLSIFGLLVVLWLCLMYMLQNEFEDFEIDLDVEELDRDMLVLPHVLDVSVSFIPIHDFVPSNLQTSPFIAINNWL